MRRIDALLEHVVNWVPVTVLSQRWGFTPACFYQWLNALILDGLDSLGYQRGGGRKAKLTPSQKKRLCQLIDAGPAAASFATGGWNSILIRVLIEREFKVLYDRYYN